MEMVAATVEVERAAAMGAEATVVGWEEVLRAVEAVEVVREVVTAVGATVAREAAGMAVGWAVAVMEAV